MISATVFDQPIHIGDNLRVHSKVQEGGKTRVQAYDGILISLRGRGENKTFTVRRMGAGGVGVERTWSVDARSLVKIEVKKKATKVRRAKLYYLRQRIGRRAVRFQ